MKTLATVVVLALGLTQWGPRASADADLVIAGVIGQQMGQASTDLLKLAETKKYVNILIDSPGGSVYAGWDFMSTMQQVKASGTRLDCYVTGMAASMAFQILNYCDNRYALPYSTVLWHPVRISSDRNITPQKALETYRSLVYIERELVGQLRETFTPPAKYFRFHYQVETLHLARSVNAAVPNYLKIVTKAPKITDSTKVPKSQSFFFKKSSVQYIHPRALKLYQTRKGIK